MTVLALDPGKVVGWARPGHAGTLDISHCADEGEAIAIFMRWLADELSENRPVYLAVERPIFARAIRNADFTTALARAAHAIAWMHDVPRHELTADQVRKKVFGKARGHTDRDRIAKARALGFDLASDHAADAALLLVAAEGRG